MVDEREKKVILLVACLASFLVPFTGSSITVALPAIAAQFNADAVTLGWITSAYIVSAALFIVPFGRLADIFGRKKIFVLGVLIFTIASLACALAPSSAILIAARFIQGIGGAMLFATSVAMVTQVYSQGERGWALGITIATVYAGLSIGPFLGGILTDHYGWPAIFFINVPIGLATIALTLKGVSHEWADATGERWIGCIRDHGIQCDFFHAHALISNCSDLDVCRRMCPSRIYLVGKTLHQSSHESYHLFKKPDLPVFQYCGYD
jgi:MFS family permease